MPTYLITEMGMGQTESFIATSISLFAYIFLIFLMGQLSDRFGPQDRARHRLDPVHGTDSAALQLCLTAPSR